MDVADTAYLGEILCDSPGSYAFSQEEVVRDIVKPSYKECSMVKIWDMVKANEDLKKYLPYQMRKTGKGDA